MYINLYKLYVRVGHSIIIATIIMRITHFKIAQISEILSIMQKNKFQTNGEI